MICSSIDLGTNTCLLLVTNWDSERKQVTEVLEDHAHIVRLGQGVDQDRKIHPDAMDRALSCLKLYAHRIKTRGLDPKKTIAVATSQARDSMNAQEFFDRVEKETGFRFRKLSGDEEALYTFKGALLPGMDEARSVVIDIGGGSTEFRSQNSGQSLDMGSVRFTERYLKSDPVDDQEFWTCQEKIDEALSELALWRKSLEENTTLVAVAGTATTLAQWHLGLKQFNALAVDRCSLMRGDLHRMVEDLKWRTIEERLNLPGVEEGRADVLLAGALILWRTMEVLDFPSVAISSRGLRFGVMELSSSF